MDTIRPLDPVSWSSVPLALRITFPDASSHALRLTLRRRRLPHGEQQFAPDGSPVYPKSREAKLSTASGATPVLTHVAPLPGFCRSRLAFACASDAIRSACSDFSCPPLVLTRWSRTVSRSNCSLSLPSSPSGIDPHLMALLVVACVTAPRAGCPLVVHPLLTLEDTPEPIGRRRRSCSAPSTLPLRLRLPSTWYLKRQSPPAAKASDYPSVVAVVEPTDQAAADVPCLVDLMATSDFTQHLLNDPHAPMAAVSLEEQALAPARVLARVPYLERLLGLVQQGCAPAELPAACAPAIAQAHADLATYLAAVLVGLFDPARLELLPEALADYRKLGDPEVVTRALLAQINYTADVAANMPPHTYTTASGIFRFAWRGRQKSTTIVLRLRTVYMYLPQPCILPAQPACGHAAAYPVPSCLSHGCTWPGGLCPCPMEVRVSAQPTSSLRRMVHVPAPLWAAPHGCLCSAPNQLSAP